MGIRRKQDDITFELLASHCDTLLGRVRAIVAPSKNFTPDSIEAKELLVNIEIFLAMDHFGLASIHPEPAEVANWHSRYLAEFDGFASEMWDPESTSVARKRDEAESIFQSLMASARKIHG